MSVWLCIPSKRSEAEGTLPAWRERGYRIAVVRENGDGPTCSDYSVVVPEYLGWARSTNLLIRALIIEEPDAQWFVIGGDDILPDENKTADEIEEQCTTHFRGTIGVMQPTGDRWGDRGDMHGAVIDRICGSAWLGYGFCRRANLGTGPLHEGYYHNFADEELQHVAQRLGILWQRRDLVQYHRHWARMSGGQRSAMPAWAAKINDPKRSDWYKSQALFQERKKAGFPGSELLP